MKKFNMRTKHKLPLSNKFMSLAIIFLLSINATTATGDNDGSAFITKAEFDSLKNNFQAQLDTFNTSIDSKIDSAIASYLSGISIDQEPWNLYDSFVTAAGENPVFLQLGSTPYGTDSVEAKWVKKSTNRMYADIVNNLGFHFAYMEQPACYRDRPVYGHCANFHCAVTCGGQTDYDPATGWSGRIISNVASQNSDHGAYTCIDLSPTLSFSASNGKETFKKTLFTGNESETEGGSGAGWLYQVLNGKPCLKYYCIGIYPQYDVQLTSHIYKKYPLSSDNYFKDAGKNLSPTWTARKVTAIIGGTVSDGTSPAESSTSDDGKATYMEVKGSIIKTTDSLNYLNYFWSADRNYGLYTYDEDYSGGGADTANKKTISGKDLTWYDLYYATIGASSQKNTLSKASGEVTPVEFKPDLYDISAFANYTASTVYGEDIYHGDGMPVAKTRQADGKYKLTITLASKSGSMIDLRISDKPFTKGAFNGDEIINEEVSLGKHEYTIDELKNENDVLWVFVKNNSGDDAVEISDLDIVLA